jgi:hypothetical protein
MEIKTFKIYPLDGQVFSVELGDFNTDREKFKLYGDADQASTLLADQYIAAIYHPNKPQIDWRLLADQPRLFKIYLRNHTDSPLEIYAHYFKALENDTLEFRYKFIMEASGYGGMRVPIVKDEKVDDVYIKRSEVVAIVPSDPLPVPSQP